MVPPIPLLRRNRGRANRKLSARPKTKKSRNQHPRNRANQRLLFRTRKKRSQLLKSQRNVKPLPIMTKSRTHLPPLQLRRSPVHANRKPNRLTMKTLPLQSKLRQESKPLPRVARRKLMRLSRTRMIKLRLPQLSRSRSVEAGRRRSWMPILLLRETWIWT